MTSVFYIPYSESAPQTTNLRALRDELARVREVYGPGSSQGAEAFNRLSREAGRQGRPLDGLRRYSKDEDERFFARIVPGPDGHHYWDGPQDFRRNDGRYRRPARWWWEHVHGPIGTTTMRLRPICGDSSCILPGHAELHHFSEQQHTDESLLARLQVLALRLGHTPSRRDWDGSGNRPFASVFSTRFGSWTKAVRAAGLEPRDWRPVATPDACRRSLRLARRVLNRWPTSYDYERPEVREALKAAGLPSSPNWIKHRLGRDWETALRSAGKK